MTTDRRLYEVFSRSVSDACDWQTWQSLNSLKEWTVLDSMAILEFLAGIEKEFDVRFAPDDLELALFTDRPRLIRYLTEVLKVN
ncbi:MAG: acyl carrier protein [Pirellulales bacterium]